MTRYGIERLLHRLSVSPHRDHFVLKGALLLALLAACAQIEVSKRPVEAVVRSTPTPAGWDTASARDLQPESVHALGQSLLEPSTRIEAIDADAFWAGRSCSRACRARRTRRVRRSRG